MPPEPRGACGAPMEDVVDVDQRPDDPQRPRVCLEEPPVPLIQEVRPPLPAAEGQPERDASESERNGTANIFMFTAPLRGFRPVRVREHTTAIDWAPAGQQRLDTPSPEAERLRLVCDHLHTQGMGSLSEACPPAQARRLASRLEIHPTPTHGSGLHLAERERRALTRQGLDRRLPDLATLINETPPWAKRRQASPTGVDWQFSTHDARVNLTRLSPHMQS
jgi:hypothetical protein